MRSSDLAHLHKRLEELAALPDKWDGRRAPPPSPEAADLMRACLRRVTLDLAVRAELVPDVEGGLALYLYGDNPARGGCILVSNEGELTELYRDRLSEVAPTVVDDFQAHEFELVAARIKNFLTRPLK